MYVTGCNYGFVKFLSQLHDFFIDLNQVFHSCFALAHHEQIVAIWLDFQIIIEIHQTGDFFHAFSAIHRLIQFSRFTRRTNNQSFFIFQIFTFWNPRLSVEIFYMGIRYQTV